MTFQQRFARFVTTVVVRVPPLWRVFRRSTTRNFDRLAPAWEATRVSALAAVPAPPARVLDVGTGTGAVARLLVELFPDAEVTGVDVSPKMIAEARRLGRQRYDVGDASHLPYADDAFDLVAQNNMIPFFDELARVTTPGGHVAVAYSMGPNTPIWVPLERVRLELERRGFTHVADFSVGAGLSLLARKA